jgi:hypothetical protein
MNNQEVRFSCTALKGTNKQGILPADQDGYYTMPIGGLNVFNSAGDYYPYEAAKELFTGSSALMRRVKAGCLKGEYGHPSMLPGQSLESFAQRVMKVDEKNVCVHYSEIWLDFDTMRDESGRPIIAMMGKLKPSGPYGPALQASLENKKEDVCFSIRAFTEDVRINGIKHRQLKEIVTVDGSVTEPGISFARKYKAPALESFSDTIFSKENIEKTIAPALENISMESDESIGLRLFKTLGWDFDPKDVPSFLKW